MIGLLLLLALGESNKSPSPQEAPIQSLNLTTAVGNNCGPTNIYYIFGVDATPWPPTPSTSAVISMGGMFLINASVQNLIYATYDSGIIVSTSNVAMNNVYTAGQEVIFEIAVSFPALPGEYMSVVSLEGAGIILCCWSISYTIY